MTKAIIFDLYETLVTGLIADFVPPEFSMAERIGVSEDVYRLHWDRLTDEWELGGIADFNDVPSRLYAEVGLPPDGELLDVLVEERVAQFAGAAAVGMRPLWATWFLDRWPVGIGPRSLVVGNEWRQGSGGKCPFPSVESPEELVSRLIG